MFLLAGTGKGQMTIDSRGTSKLTKLALVAAVAAVLVGTAGVSPAGAKKQHGDGARQSVCHFQSGGGTYKLLELPAKAHSAHLRHGDANPGDFVPGSDEQLRLDGSCQVVPVEADSVGTFALARSGAVSVAELVDSNGDGIPSAGDTVLMGQYPLDFDASGFGSFNKAEHTVEVVEVCDANRWLRVTVDTPSGSFVDFFDGGMERFWEHRPNLDNTMLRDGITRSTDKIEAEVNSPSEPDPPVDLDRRSVGEGDDHFVDVELDFSCR